MELRLHETEENVKVLGPGKRYVVWVQGCDRKCVGCMSPETREKSGGYLIDVGELAERVINSACDGLTISGGEPFLQAGELAEFIRLIRRKKDMGVIIYTGNTWEELKNSSDKRVQALLGECDLLIDGPYMEELHDGKNLRGSSNQRAIPLTKRYEKDALEYGTKEAQFEFIVREDSIRMVGVPKDSLLKKLQNMNW